jgi:hypothetical protein
MSKLRRVRSWWKMLNLQEKHCRGSVRKEKVERRIPRKIRRGGFYYRIGYCQRFQPTTLTGNEVFSKVEF